MEIDPTADTNLGIDVATAPELEDAELGAVLEALLLVVDTPVTVDALGRGHRAAGVSGGRQAAG